MVDNSTVAKVVLTGDKGVGKTALWHALSGTTEPESSAPSIQVLTQRTAQLPVPGTDLSVSLCDYGDPKVVQASTSVYRKAAVVLVCYDVSNRESFSVLRTWISEIDRYNTECVKVVVGCKSDVEDRQVQRAEAEDFCDTLGVDMVEVSTVSGVNELKDLLLDLVKSDVEDALREDEEEQPHEGEAVQVETKKCIMQ